MQPLMTAKRVLIWLCIYPSLKAASMLERTAHAVFAVMIFFGLIFGAIAHMAFMIKYGTTDLKGSIFSFNGSFGVSSTFYIMITVFSMRNQISSILDQLSFIYTNREY